MNCYEFGAQHQCGGVFDIQLIDAGERLSAYFDLDLAALLPVARQTSALPLERRPLEGYEA